MNIRKNVNSIASGETLNHTGDLTIEGDINENSVVNVTDGALIIKGNVKKGAHINLSVSEELRNIISSTNNTSSISMSLGNINIGNSIQANLCMSMGNKQIMIGNVNINGRIQTDDEVMKLGNGQYKITPASDSPYGKNLGRTIGIVKINGVTQVPHTIEGYAIATIDGKRYVGKEITVDAQYNVLVNGPLVNSSAEAQQKPKETPKLLIHGNIEDAVEIKSDAEIEVKGTIGNSCQIHSHFSTITAHDIDENTNINASNKITVATVGKNCTLTSQDGGLHATTLKDNVNVSVNKSIDINNNVGNSCYLESKYGSLKANNIGEDVTAKIYKEIKVRNIESKSKLKSEYHGLSAQKIGNNVVIRAYKDVDLTSVGDNCNIKSEFHRVKVTDTVGNDATIKTYKDIEIGTLGNSANLTSQKQSINIAGNAGNQVRLKAYKSVQAKNIGDHSSITSESQGVSVKDVGTDVNISAYKDIIVDGSCPPNTHLHSSNGKVKVSPQPSTIKQQDSSTFKPAEVIQQNIFASRPAAVTAQENLFSSQQSNAIKSQGLFANVKEPSEQEKERVDRILWEEMIWKDMQQNDPTLKSMLENQARINGTTPYDVFKHYAKEVNEERAKKGGTPIPFV